MKRIFTILFLALLISVGRQAYALGEMEFTQAVSMFKKAQYAEALNKFIAARQVGMDEPRLSFNLALCYLKLDQYDQAREEFLNAAQHKPLAGLAWFNIGLLELKRGNREEAIVWFNLVRDSAQQAKLRALAEQKLVQLEQTNGNELSKAIWDSGYRLHLGYDDNIEDPALIGTTDKGDSFTSALAYVTWMESGADSWRVGAVAFIQHYNTVKIYDLDLFQLTLDKGFSSGDWHNRLGTELEATTLGGNDYLQTGKFYISGKLPLSAMDELRLRYRYSSVSAMSPTYDYLAGDRHELELRWQHQRNSLKLQAGYEYEMNDRNDYRGTTVFSSYSPNRHTIDLRADVAFAGGWQLDSRIHWRSSLYQEANILADSSTVKRADERLMLSLGTTYPLADSLDLGFEYKFTENHSNIDTYHYIRHIYTLGISGTF